MKKIILALGLIVSFSAQASLVGVADSGTFFGHELLKGREAINTKEIPGNMLDDDGNGKIDDVLGWNFAEGYGKTFFADHLNYINPIIYKMFAVIARQQEGVATDDDKKFWELNVTSLSKTEKSALFEHLGYFGQYAHGTHVSGIVALANADAKILPARMFPDQPPNEYVHPKGMEQSGKKGVMDWVYKMLATMTNGAFDQAGVYMGEREAVVANYSLGVSLQNLAKVFLGLRGNKTPTPEEISKESARLFTQYEPLGRKWMAASQNTLFVIAAGNDGTNNDVLPIFPGSVRAENSITVAASLGHAKLATFSNYGKDSVDIAAPGVNIMSSVPSLDGKIQIGMSGTSMAAPNVTGVASKIKDINSKLTPAEVKQVLMGTVDHKEWLKDKVISQGVMNPSRAYVAAEKSLSMPLATAISESRASVQDVLDTRQSAEKSFMPTPADLEVFANGLVF